MKYFRLIENAFIATNKVYDLFDILYDIYLENEKSGLCVIIDNFELVT